MDVKHVQKLFVITNCLLITFFAFNCIDLFYSVITTTTSIPDSHDSSQATFASNQTSVLQSRIKPLSDYMTVNKRNIFGIADKNKEITPEDISKLDITDLSLKLHGTSVTNHGPSYAILEDTQKRNGRYRSQLIKEGNSINEAVLTKVFRDKVILSVNGLKQILLMEQYDRRQRGRRRSRRYNLKPRTPIHQKKTIRRQVIDNALNDMGTLLKQARVRPHFKSGAPDGFIISGIRHASLFQKLGLRNGDIITDVNGQEINSVDDAMSFYSNLKSSGQIAIQLRRRGRERIINYNIK